MGDQGQSTAHFEDALAFCGKAGYLLEIALTLCYYADTLLQGNEPGDREKAMSMLGESLSIASMFSGMPLNSVNHLPKQLTEETRLEPNLNTLRDPAGPISPDAIPLGGLSFQYIFEMR